MFIYRERGIQKKNRWEAQPTESRARARALTISGEIESALA